MDRHPNDTRSLLQILQGEEGAVRNHGVRRKSIERRSLRRVGEHQVVCCVSVSKLNLRWFHSGSLLLY